MVGFELESALHARVAELCGLGDTLVEGGDLDAAVEKYEEALALLPPPASRWNAATWILTALGDTFFLKKDYRQALSVLDDATRCPRGLGNPFVHLRLGQAALELGNGTRARRELARAYMAAAEAIFAEEDPKYLSLAKAAVPEIEAEHGVGAGANEAPDGEGEPGP